MKRFMRFVNQVGLPTGLMFLFSLSQVAAAPVTHEVTATPVRAFLDSLGVCTHIGQDVDQASRCAAALAYAGMRNIRDDGNPKHVADWIALHRQIGIKVVLTRSGPNEAAIGSLLRSARKLAAAGALLALEGPNEPNNWAVTYQGQKSKSTVTFLPVAKWQRAFYRRAKRDPVLKHYPVFASSEAGGSEPNNVGLQFLTIPSGADTLMPDGTQYADYANVHNYLARQPHLLDNMTWLNADPVFHGWSDSLYVEYGKTWRKGFPGYTRAQLRTLPRVTTETGWKIGDKGLTPAQQARLYLNLYLAQFKEGFKYTFIYMLHDGYGSDAHWGLFDRNYRPKPAATCLHHLTTILADPGHVATPGQLSYAIPNPPPTVHDVLLQKSNGQFELVVWDERVSGSDRVTIHLSRQSPTVRLYDPTIGWQPTQTLHDVRSVHLTLRDHPVVIELRERKNG